MAAAICTNPLLSNMVFLMQETGFQYGMTQHLPIFGDSVPNSIEEEDEDVSLGNGATISLTPADLVNRVLHVQVNVDANQQLRGYLEVEFVITAASNDVFLFTLAGTTTNHLRIFQDALTNTINVTNHFNEDISIWLGCAIGELRPLPPIRQPLG